jgi:phage terminase large subunit-like protein
MHATGEYPDWWEGRKFLKEGCKIWVGSESNEASRDIVQVALLGPLGHWGTGAIPQIKIIGKPKTRQAGVPDVVDTIHIDHSSGDISEINFKTYEQGRDKWQGTRKHVVWFDEEPSATIYSEGLTRTADLGGIVMLTATPLKGVSEVIRMFMDPKPGARMFLKNVTWDDAPHLTEAVKADLWASYPEHERETRVSGQPLMGIGAIFPIDDKRLEVDPFQIPDWWPRINGIDFGIAHPFAGAFCAYDREADTFYIYDCFRVKGETPVHHCNGMRRHGEWIPTAWPKDGLQRDKGSGEVLKNQYRQHKLYMLPEHAKYHDERGDHVEPGLIEMYEYMKAGKFRVFKTCREWFEEKRLYHRDEKGQVVKEHDDLVSASRYAFVMRRAAMVKPRQLAASMAPAVPMIGGRR